MTLIKVDGPSRESMAAKRLRGITIAMVVLGLFYQGAIAHDTEGDRAQDEPDYPQRLARVRYLEQYKMSEGLRQRAVLKIQRAALESTGLPPQEAARMLFRGRRFAFPFTAQPELKSDGEVRTLTVLVDFKNHRAGNHLPNRAQFHANIYGNGTPVAQGHIPYESVHAYYTRASEGIVDLQGDVLDWHHFSKNREEYEPGTARPGPFQFERQQLLDNEALFDMAVEVLNAQDSTHDFAQYDNDFDGDIDLLTILYAGPPGSWMSFWWAYRWEFFASGASTTRFDGKRLKQFVFQFVDERDGTNDFDPRTLIHEMGHAFGLADYYDYDTTRGPAGGVGGLDMMHGNWGNHCAFSRWLLDWIKPEVIGGGAPTQKRLVASGSTTGTGVKAVAIFPGLPNTAAPSSEMFIIENRHRVGNDGHNANTPNNGLLIWHVEATVNVSGSDFASDNSLTDHKLIRLVRADSAQDFGDTGRANANTYFNVGSEFTANSKPSSSRIDGTPSNVSVTGISVAGEIITAHIGIATPSAPPPLAAAADDTSSGLLDSVVQAMDTSVDFDKLNELDKKLATATPDQLRSLWPSVKSTDVAGDELNQSTLAKQLILTRWASKDGKAAAEAVLAIPNAAFVQKTYPAVMQSWAASNAAAAAEWYFADEQTNLRNSRDLRAGAAFAEKLFCCTALIDRQKAVKQLDELVNVREIYGALKGLQHANAFLAVDAETVEAGYQNLTRNKAVIHEMQKLQIAIEQVELGSIDDERVRNDFKQFLLDGISLKKRAPEMPNDS